MRVTLYKNCILNNSYNEVIDNHDEYKVEDKLGTALTHYLDSLTKIEFELNVSYATLSGSLTFPLGYDDGTIIYNSKSFYQYNYMKIEEDLTSTDKLLRYMFINSISIIDGFAIINFSEDIWSNYADKIQFRDGILSRSRGLSYSGFHNMLPSNWSIPYYNLPLIYKSNNAPIFKRLTNANSTPTGIGYFYVVVLMQLYDTDSQGEVTNRFCLSGVITDKGISTEYITSFKIEGLKQVVELITKSSGNQFSYTDATPGIESKKYNYEITKVLLIPDDFKYINIDFSKVHETGTFDYKPFNKRFDLYPADICFGVNHVKTTIAELTPYTIDGSDFKTLGIGLRNNIEVIELNGSDIEVTPVISITDTTLNIYLKMQNKFIDITSDLTMDIPISVQTREVTQLKELNRNVENKLLDLSNFSNGLDIGAGVANTAINFGKQVTDIVSFGGGLDGNIDVGGAEGVVNSSVRVGKGIIGLIGNEEKRNLVNASYYTSNKALYIQTRDSILNASGSLVAMQVNPDNENEVISYVNESGYVVNEFIKLDLINNYKPTGLEYNVLKFDYVRFYGAFPQNIKTQLESILINGFKVWYTENV